MEKFRSRKKISRVPLLIEGGHGRGGGGAGQKPFGQCLNGGVSLRQKGASLNCTVTEKHFFERYSSNNVQEIHF